MMTSLRTLFLMLLFAIAAQTAIACPGCKSTLAADEELRLAEARQELVLLTSGTGSVEAAEVRAEVTTARQKVKTTEGYFYSILLMMSAPFTILTIFGLALAREIQKAKRARVEAGYLAPTPGHAPAAQ